ncbi:exodeoxyribonuclease VII, large subunit [Chloroherpeton thalassium ATCC 35110]|uniref:Exodeoxyribonuclease 7 large subunit n=1 Tax=Chloroherpeton thalassium (strain ATCC 35110 / GB-78) TaxID=517418 RepID=B3QT34_CHLT3|nr:exodeoxyribonuclease VII large subunit [Chloroherpeton thalassium]ACF14133.1 exodeoxyribonuclease VII, large subunit [Chloroherpeton thalassium ATCC 35110]
MTAKTYTVSALTDAIRASLEQTFPDFSLRGEISNFKRHSSGHIYFTLKDSGAQIPVIIWRSLAQKLRFEMQDGLEIVVEGRLEVYPPSGRYQVICTNVSPVGEGILQQAFARLMQTLAKDGLFDDAHKKDLPRLPELIGVVTSPTGAVIQDIQTVLARRYPAAQLTLFPVRVQGEEAMAEIVAAISYFNRQTGKNRPDVLIVGRGGGSLEDLWAFNEESVARAIFASGIPIISAVGHETDITIADLVADVRAATPSMAAELAAPSHDEIQASIDGALQQMAFSIASKIEGNYRQVNSILGSYAFNRPVRTIENKRQQVENQIQQMERGLVQKWMQADARFKLAEGKLYLLGHENILKRGYALVLKDGKPIRQASSLSAGDLAKLKFQDGEKTVRVEDDEK